MLHAKDLMIGDWVKSRGKIEQVTSVYEGYICTDTFEDSHDYYFEPIPLTSEILEKNGFKEEQLPIGVRKVIWESEDTRTEIVLYMDDTMPMEIRKNIYYEDEICYTLPFVWAVHQLQQVLRLCNIEKTIEL